MQPLSSSSLRPPPPSSSSSFRPPFHGSVGRPPVGSSSTMDASRPAGSKRALSGNFGSADRASMEDDDVQQRMGHSFDVQQQLERPQGLGNSSESPHVHDFPILNGDAVINGDAVLHNRSLREKESLKDQAIANPTSRPLDMETKQSLTKSSSLHGLTMEDLVAKLTDLERKLQNSHQSRSKSRRPWRSSSRAGRPPVRSPPMAQSWSKVVQSTDNSPPKMALQFFPPEITPDGVAVNPPIEVAEEGAGRWKRTLVGYFIEGRPSFMVVKEQVTKLWGAKGLVDVMANDRGFFFFTFSTAEECTTILEAGPWIFQRQPLFLQPWKPGMRLFRETHDTVPLWVKLFNVPLEYWSEKGFSYLGSAVGVPLFPDSMTMSGRCVNFMRLCVEVNASRPLVESFDLLLPPNPDGSPNSVKIRVEYPWKPKICSHCHVFGHLVNNCFKLKKEQEAVMVTSEIPLVVASHKDKEDTGPILLDIEDVTAIDSVNFVDSRPSSSVDLVPKEPPSIPIVQQQMDGFNEPMMNRNVPAEGSSRSGSSLAPMVVPISTSPNKFSCLGGDDDGFADPSIGDLASKIQHIDGGFASAKKKKNKAKTTGAPPVTVGQLAQHHRPSK